MTRRSLAHDQLREPSGADTHPRGAANERPPDRSRPDRSPGWADPAQSSPPVLGVNVGSSSVKAALHAPDLRMQLRIDNLYVDHARVTIDGTGGFVEHALLPDRWGGAIAEITDAVARVIPSRT